MMMLTRQTLYQNFSDDMSLYQGDYGLEFEFEGTGRRPFPQIFGWLMTNDGSLRHQGIEYVSIGGLRFSEVSPSLTDFRRSLLERYPEEDFIFENRGGIHIHRNLQQLNLKELIRFFAYVTVLEPHLVAHCDPDRHGNHFCLQTCEASTVFHRMSKDFFINQWPGTWTSSTERFKYSAINWCNLLTRGAVEFRMLESTLDMAKVMRFVNTIERVYQLSLDDTRDEMMSDLFFRDLPEFVRTLLPVEDGVPFSVDVLPHFNTTLRFQVGMLMEHLTTLQLSEQEYQPIQNHIFRPARPIILNLVNPMEDSVDGLI